MTNAKTGLSYVSFVHSASAKSSNPLSETPLFVAMYITTWFLECYQDLTLSEVLMFLNVPNVLGGAPIFYLDQIMVRAENDHLTTAITYLKFLYNAWPGCRQWILSVLNQPFDINPKPARLMTDICALALRAPSRTLNIIKYWISKNLRKVIRDINLREILAVCTDRAREEFCETPLFGLPLLCKGLECCISSISLCTHWWLTRNFWIYSNNVPISSFRKKCAFRQSDLTKSITAGPEMGTFTF